MKRPVFWASVGLAVLAAYGLALRPRLLTWGTREGEAERPLPGDDLVSRPWYVTTRAITIQAEAADIWPWLVQIGQGRGGLYSYDRIENLMGLDFHSADRIVPEFQDLELGDIISLAPDEAMPLGVVVLEPNRALVIETREERTGGSPIAGDLLRGEIHATWAFILDQLDGQATRFLVRFRGDWRPSIVSTLLARLLLDPAHFVMERKMILGIKQRAEAMAGSRPKG